MTEALTIIGAGPAGLACGIGAARRGVSVTILERDPPQPLEDPAGAFDTWTRLGVAHELLPHSLLGRTRRALREHAPEVLEQMLREGAWENRVGARLAGPARQAGDEDLVVVHARRPFFECLLRRAAEAEPLLTIRSNVKVVGVEATSQRPPRVTGVLTDAGMVPAQLVVDAGGRRSPVRRSLEEAGIALPAQEAEPCGLIYYCRYFRLREGVEYPAWKGAVGPSGTTDSVRFSVFFGDNRTFAIVLGVLTSLRELRALSRSEVFMAAVAKFAVLAPFVQPEVALPTTDVVPFGSLQNVFHEPLLDGEPPVLGLHFIGDAYCHTNPLFAWGLCLGLDNGFRLGELIAQHPNDAHAQALALADLGADEARQCFHAVAEEDRDRTAEWSGEPLSGPWSGRTFAGFVRHCALPAIGFDPDVARAVLRRSNLLDKPDELTRNEEVLRRVMDLQPQLPKPVPGAAPSRDDLVELATASSTGN
jgi:2-polyprenyl-6-methoxyphenol hydroxylase-like FAD-dependent oxidoreductase